MFFLIAAFPPEEPLLFIRHLCRNYPGTAQLSLKKCPVEGGTFRIPWNYWGVWLYAKDCWLSECASLRPHFRNLPQKWSERRNAIRTANKLVELNVGHTLKLIQKKLKVPKKVLTTGAVPVNSNQADLNRIPRALTCPVNANHRLPFVYSGKSPGDKSCWKRQWKTGSSFIPRAVGAT